jgi:hypothetical protein
VSWSAPRPLEGATWEQKQTEVFYFLREIHRRFVFGSFVWAAPEVPVFAGVDTTLTSATLPELAGLRAGMATVLTPPAAIDPGLSWAALVPADDQILIRLRNFTGLPITQPIGTWAFQGVIP